MGNGKKLFSNFFENYSFMIDKSEEIHQIHRSCSFCEFHPKYSF